MALQHLGKLNTMVQLVPGKEQASCFACPFNMELSLWGGAVPRAEYVTKSPWSKWKNIETCEISSSFVNFQSSATGVGLQYIW